MAAQLHPDGLFANLEVVASPTPELHAEFLALIGRPEDDPEDRLVEVSTQLDWMRAAGLVQVDCMWKWRGPDRPPVLGRLPVVRHGSPSHGGRTPCP